MSTPYIPAPDSAFALWLANFSAKITAAPTTYGLVSGDATAIAAVATPFATAFAVATDPATRTSSTIATKDTARANAELTVRPYAVRISLNPAVDDSDKVDVGVTVKITTPTPVPAPTVAPILSLISQSFGTATLAYKTTGATNKAKPYGVIGVEIVQSIGTVFATDPEQCDWLAQVGKSPFPIAWANDDAGKKATYFARFRTRSGPAGISQAGPWSGALNLIVT